MRWLRVPLGLDRGRVCFDPVADEAGDAVQAIGYKFIPTLTAPRGSFAKHGAGASSPPEA